MIITVSCGSEKTWRSGLERHTLVAPLHAHAPNTNTNMLASISVNLAWFRGRQTSTLTLKWNWDRVHLQEASAVGSVLTDRIKEAFVVIFIFRSRVFDKRRNFILSLAEWPDFVITFQRRSEFEASKVVTQRPDSRGPVGAVLRGSNKTNVFNYA